MYLLIEREICPINYALIKLLFLSYINVAFMFNFL